MIPFVCFLRMGLLRKSCARYLAPMNSCSIILIDRVIRFTFFEKNVPAHPQLMLLLQQLKNELQTNELDPLWQEAQFHRIMTVLLQSHCSASKDRDSIDALKLSTRDELYRRISIAHDYIQAFYEQPLKLEDIAGAACLSVNHLLRSYVQVYTVTPYQHITALRLAKAKQLLTNRAYSMTDITLAIGLNSPASFSRLFKQHFRISPRDYRKKGDF